MQRFLVLIVGIIFISISVFLYFKNEHLIKNCTVETEATVVDMKQELSNDDSSSMYTYYPIIEYQAEGNMLRETIDKGSSTPAYEIDEKITILYNPDKTNEFIVKGDNSSNIFSIVFLFIGVIVTGYGIKIAITKN